VLQGQFDFEPCDAVRSFADAHGMAFRGHNLCWGEYNPAWLEALDGHEKRGALTSHIAAVAGRYGDAAFAWDVVNEAVADGPCAGASFCFKNSTWYPAVPTFLEDAFFAARAACPDCQLFYNDYNIASDRYLASEEAPGAYMYS